MRSGQQLTAGYFTVTSIFLTEYLTFIYKEIYEKFHLGLITGMNPKASFGVSYAVPLSFARGIIHLRFELHFIRS